MCVCVCVKDALCRRFSAQKACVSASTLRGFFVEIPSLFIPYCLFHTSSFVQFHFLHPPYIFRIISIPIQLINFDPLPSRAIRRLAFAVSMAFCHILMSHHMFLRLGRYSQGPLHRRECRSCAVQRCMC